MNIKLAAICMLMSCNLLAQTSTNTITFIGNNDYQIKQSNLATEYQFHLVSYNLDGLKNLEKSIIKDLPKDIQKAQKIANQRLDDIDQSVMVSLFKASSLLLKWDIKKIPAMVFGDGEYVIYGVTDTGIAIKRFLNSRKR